MNRQVTYCIKEDLSTAMLTAQQCLELIPDVSMLTCSLNVCYSCIADHCYEEQTVAMDTVLIIDSGGAIKSFLNQ